MGRERELELGWPGEVVSLLMILNDVDTSWIFVNMKMWEYESMFI